MAAFRKKPIEVEAFPVNDLILAEEGKNRSVLPPWLRIALEQQSILVRADRARIKTLEGWLQASRDDWLIRGVKGELYACKPDVFEATYERVTENER